MSSSTERTWKFGADIERIDDVCKEVTGLVKDIQLTRKDCFAIELLLREALVNAVVHGNQEDPQKMVCCRLEITADEVRIEVTDEGPGFDWQAEKTHRKNPLAESGRGLAIYDLYATASTFNETGNQVTLTRVYSRKE